VQPADVLLIGGATDGGVVVGLGFINVDVGAVAGRVVARGVVVVTRTVVTTVEGIWMVVFTVVRTLDTVGDDVGLD
jgi:hypothetical protein